MYFSFPAFASLILLQVSTLPHSIVGALELHSGDQDSFENTSTENNKVRGVKSKKFKNIVSTVIDDMFTVMEQPESTVAACK
jgi:hypothetical protein